jgi:hypothetical protein
LQPIEELWASRNEKEWSDALARYWKMRTVLKKLELEKYMDKLDPQAIKRLEGSEWYAFLEKYFCWKFDGNYLSLRLNNLKSNSPEQLFRVRESLFALTEIDLANIRKPLNTVKSPQIKGLGYAGASGLLAVLFPKSFGTADKFVVRALCKIVSLPERSEVLVMAQTDAKGKDVPLNEKNAALLIDIMRRKATDLNALFGPDKWTPRMIDMILWASPRDGADARCLSQATS